MDTSLTFPKGNIFGILPIEPNFLVSALDKVPGRPPRTSKVFSTLTELARTASKEHDLRTFPSVAQRHKKRQGAFLLDYMWWKQKFGTSLAVESELSDHGIPGNQHDFEKLLCWKAPLKLMICVDFRKTTAECLREKLSTYAQTSTCQMFKDEVYLLFIFGKQRNFAYYHIVPRDSDCGFEFKEFGITP